MARYKLVQAGGVIDTTTGIHLMPGAVGWREYEDFLYNHNVPDPWDAMQPLVAPPPPFDFKAAGAAREQRRLEAQAKTDPVLQRILDMKGSN